eukprot:365539-Chlamydomonas_euryale.AAC.2
MSVQALAATCWGATCRAVTFWVASGCPAALQTSAATRACCARGVGVRQRCQRGTQQVFHALALVRRKRQRQLRQTVRQLYRLLRRTCGTPRAWSAGRRCTKSARILRLRRQAGGRSTRECVSIEGVQTRRRRSTGDVAGRACAPQWPRPSGDAVP